MKISTKLDPWGGIEMEIAHESSHEETLLHLISQKRMAEMSVLPDGTIRMMFREYEPIQISASSSVTIPAATA